jgi:hypothetical protein
MEKISIISKNHHRRRLIHRHHFLSFATTKHLKIHALMSQREKSFPSSFLHTKIVYEFFGKELLCFKEFFNLQQEGLLLMHFAA